MDTEIEGIARKCELCQQSCGLPPVAPLHPWACPSAPGSRINLDYAGPIAGQMFLVLIDAHTKWLEVFPVPAATSTETIQQLRTTFARFGLPHTVVTDNGSCFTSEEFAIFLTKNGVCHVKTAPYHPSSNGQAEHVQVFKNRFKKLRDGTVSDRLARFLLSYRITPHSTTGLSPAELVFGRNLRSRFDHVQPDVSARVEKQQHHQKEVHDNHARSRSFKVDKLVFARNFRPGSPWLSGQVVNILGLVSFEVKLTEGQIVRHHQDHLRKRTEMTESLEVDSASEPLASECLWAPPEVVSTEDDTVAPAATRNPETHTSSGDSAASSAHMVPNSVTTMPSEPSTSLPMSASQRRRYPSRSWVPPDEYCC